MATMIDREAPLSGLANLMALKGRQGDTELVHMTKPEIRGLASLGQLTINPDTGLPEAFNFKSLLPAIAGLAAIPLLGPAGLGLVTGTGLSAFAAPAAAAGLTSMAVNKGDIGAAAFDALLAGAGGALSASLSGANVGAEAVKAANVAAETGKLAGYTGASEAAQAAIKEGVQQTLGQSLMPGALTAQAISKTAPTAIQQAAAQGSLAGTALQKLGMSAADIVTPGVLGLTPVQIASGLGSSAATLGGTAALGMPMSGAGMLEAMQPPEIATPARKSAESAYGTRAAEEIKQTPQAIEGLTTEDILKSSIGQSDPIKYFQSGAATTSSTPSGVYGTPKQGIIGQPVRGTGPIGSYVPAANGGGINKDKGFKGDPQSLEELTPYDRFRSYQATQNFQNPLMRLVFGNLIKNSGEMSKAAPSASMKTASYNNGMTGASVNTGASYAAGGGGIQDLYDRMGGGYEQFRGLVEGGGVDSDGMSDDIAFRVVKEEEDDPDYALLSPDEYVIDAHTVAALGNGSTEAGTRNLDNFVANLRKKVYNKGDQPKQIDGLRELSILIN